MIVYKFKPYDTDEHKEHVFDILENRRVYLEDWNLLNDPIEGYFGYWHEKFSERLADEKRKYRVCSFSKYFANSLLWSYYAGGLTGVCVVLQLDGVELHDVTYRKRIPEFEHFDERSIDLLAKEALSTKLDYWSHEAEVRLIEKADSLVESRFLKSTPIAVLYGNRMHDQTKTDIVDLCNGRGVAHGEVLVNSDSGLSGCDYVSNNVVVNNRVGLPPGSWMCSGAGPLQGWTHKGARQCQVCGEEDFEDEFDPFKLPGFLEPHIINPDAGPWVHHPKNVALLCPSCHKRMHLDRGFAEVNEAQLKEKNKTNSG